MSGGFWSLMAGLQCLPKTMCWTPTASPGGRKNITNTNTHPSAPCKCSSHLRGHCACHLWERFASNWSKGPAWWYRPRETEVNWVAWIWKNDEQSKGKLVNTRFQYLATGYHGWISWCHDVRNGANMFQLEKNLSEANGTSFFVKL